jgi:lipopolysaccharide biosynthesis regulator YciM
VGEEVRKLREVVEQEKEIVKEVSEQLLMANIDLGKQKRVFETKEQSLLEKIGKLESASMRGTKTSVSEKEKTRKAP